MEIDSLFYAAAGGAILAAALTFGKLLLDYGLRGGEGRREAEDRHRRLQRDAEARLERILQDRLADADRRLDRYELELMSEHIRCATLEREHTRLQQAHESLQEQHRQLQADHARLSRRPRLASDH
jgi:hypothetical protein